MSSGTADFIELVNEERSYILDLIEDIENHIRNGHVDRKTLRLGIRRRANRIFSIIWVDQIEKPYLYDGKFAQIGADGLSIILGLRRPKLTEFDNFCDKIKNLDLHHPIKNRMRAVLSAMAPFVAMMEYLDTLKDTPKMPKKALYHEIDQVVDAVFRRHGSQEAVHTVISTQPGFHRQCNAAMPLARKLGLDALELAESVGADLRLIPFFADVHTVKPGFINLCIADEWLIRDQLASTLSDDPKRILIDFGSPNIAKALHVGHLRSLVIGESLRRLLSMRGHDVTGDIHFGDWGLPMGMLINSLMRDHPDYMAQFATGTLCLEDLYPTVIQACKDDPQRMADAQLVTKLLQEHNPAISQVWANIRHVSLTGIMPQIEQLGAHFDCLLGESDAQSAIEPLLDDLTWRLDDGALVVDVALPDDKTPIPPLIYRKGDLGYTYAATDLGTLALRNTVGYDTILYVVDARQSLHFTQVFRAARQFTDMNLCHVEFGTVNGPDGKPYKTRDGGVPTLASMLDAAVAKAAERTDSPENAAMIGIGAVKFADLINHRKKGYVFDVDRITALEGKTGPYMQYAVVRLKAIFARNSVNLYDMQNSVLSESAHPYLEKVVITHPAERDLLAACANFPEILAMAEAQLSPVVLAEYAFAVAQKFSQFYVNCPVKEFTESRLTICWLTDMVLVSCLYILGIEVPSKM